MASKALREDQNERLRHFMRMLLQEAGNNQSELARRLKVKQGQINEFLSGKKGAGFSLLGALSTYTGRSYDDLVAGKVVVPADGRAVERVIEREDRYPNRSRAIKAWRELQRDERAVERVASMRMDSDIDPDVEEWFAELESTNRRIGAEDKGKATHRPALDDDYGAPKLPPRKPR